MSNAPFARREPEADATYFISLKEKQMIFGGHVSAMINSLKANRDNLKAGKKKPLDKDNVHVAKEEKWVDPVQISTEERAKLNEKIRMESRQEKRRELIVTLTATAVGILILAIVSFVWIF